MLQLSELQEFRCNRSSFTFLFITLQLKESLKDEKGFSGKIIPYYSLFFIFFRTFAPKSIVTKNP